MKTILVCDDHPAVIEAIKLTTQPLADKAELLIAENLSKLFEEVNSGKKLDAIFLDGRLGPNEDTFPFLVELKAGRFPHLEETDIYLVSTDIDFQAMQAEFVEGTPWKVTRHEKRYVVEKIYKLVGA